MDTMKYTYICILLVVTTSYTNGQILYSSTSKPKIDSLAIAQWPFLRVTNSSISGDGSYFLYFVQNQPVGSVTAVVESTKGDWKSVYVGVSSGIFSGDSRLLLFYRSDTLFSLVLGTSILNAMPRIKSYQVIPAA